MDHGCNGGHYNNAFIYTKNNGISLESDYPYEQVGKIFFISFIYLYIINYNF